MPRPGHQWWRLMLGTHCSWNPGDARGFRSRDTRFRSTGDYRNPPPPDEHRILREQVSKRAGTKVRIPKDLRSLLAQHIATHFLARGYRVLVVSVGASHLHALVELPVDSVMFNRIVGYAKQSASRRITKRLPGRLFSQNDVHKRIRDKRHHRTVFRYIAEKQEPDAGIWRFDRVGKDVRG